MFLHHIRQTPQLPAGTLSPVLWSPARGTGSVSTRCVRSNSMHYIFCIAFLKKKEKKKIKSVKWPRLVGFQHRSIIPTYGWLLPWTMSDLNLLCYKWFSQVGITITAHFRFLFYLSNLSSILPHNLSCVLVPEPEKRDRGLQQCLKCYCDVNIVVTGKYSILLETEGEKAAWCVPLRLSCYHVCGNFSCGPGVINVHQCGCDVVLLF